MTAQDTPGKAVGRDDGTIAERFIASGTGTRSVHFIDALNEMQAPRWNRT